MSNYIIVKALAIFTGSRALTQIICEMKEKDCSREAFRYLKRLILECLVAEMELDSSAESNHDIRFCISKSGPFLEVCIILYEIKFHKFINIFYFYRLIGIVDAIWLDLKSMHATSTDIQCQR
jgi:hypothetical protein